jgi:hypothetical protein
LRFSPGSAPNAFWDSVLASFGVYVAASGCKTFMAQTRIRGVSWRTVLDANHHIDAIRAAAHLWLLEVERRQRPLNPGPAALPAVTLQVLADEYCANQGERWASLTFETSLGALRPIDLASAGRSPPRS